MNAQPDHFAPFFSAFETDADDAASVAAYARGHEDGSQSAEAAANHRLAAALDNLSNALRETAGEIPARIANLERECARLTALFARQLSAGLHTPQARIEAAIRPLLKDLVDQPTIQLTIAPDMVPVLEHRIAELLKMQGATGNLTLQTDFEMPPGDARVEWRGGSFRLSRALVDRSITDHIHRAFPEIQNSGDPTP